MAIATDQERLVVALEARIRDFEKNMQRASRTAGKQFGDIEKRAAQSSQRLDRSMGEGAGNVVARMASIGKNAGAIGIAVGASLGAVTAAVTDAARSIATIGDEAKRAGLGIRQFQELKYVAEQNRLGVDTLVDGIKELNLRADEFVITGKGPAAEAFARLGYSAEELKRKLADPSALFTEIIGKLGKLDEAARIRIADEIFGGTGGEKFVQLIELGADGIRKQAQEARDLGIVLDEQLVEKAAELDRLFNKITTTAGVHLKAAILDTASVLQRFLDGFNDVQEQADDTIQNSLTDIYVQMQKTRDEIADLELLIASGNSVFDEMALDRAKEKLEELAGEAMRLRDVLDRRNGYSESFTFKAGEEAKAAKPPVDKLGTALAGTGNAGNSGAKGIETFADAIRALKDEIPGLAEQLQDLDAKARIDATYRQALSKARSIGDTYLAHELRGEALRSLGLKSATDDPAKYLSTALASGKAMSHLSGLSGDFSGKLAQMFASAPDAVRSATTINSGFRSFQRQAELFEAAVKKYGSEAAARKWVAKPGSSQHNAGNAADLGFSTDDARTWFHDNAKQFGLTFPMGHEPWHIEDQNARTAANDEAFRAKYESAQQQVDAYRQITQSGRDYIAQQDIERQTLGMTEVAASRLRYEQDMLNDAQRAGIAITPQQRAEISALANDMALAEHSVAGYAASQEQAAEVSQFFGEQAVGALSGILTGAMSAEEALKSVLDSLIQAALQAAILGEGPLAGLLRGGTPNMGGGAKKGMGSILGGLVGFRTGGHVRGPGTGTSDSIVARLSDGEFVVNAASTRKHRALLEAVNDNRLPRFAKGGLVGNDGASVFAPAGGNVVSINAPVTVNGSAGTPEQNADLAKQMARQLDSTMRGVVVDEMSRQARPGNTLRRR